MFSVYGRYHFDFNLNYWSATNVGSATAKSFAFMFNGNKSHCLSLGKLANVDIDPMLFDNQSKAWCHSINFLRVHLLSSKGLSLTPLA